MYCSGLRKVFFTFKKNSVDKIIRLDVNVIGYEFKCGTISCMVWIAENVNLALPKTKADILLMNTLHLIFFENKINTGFPEAKRCSLIKSFSLK